MLSALLAATVLATQEDFYPEPSYDVSVPRPEAVLGYAPGQRHTTFREQEAVLKAIVAAAPDRARIIEYGRTPEGRPLRVVAVSHPRNIARLHQIRQEHDDLAHGKGDPLATVPIVWINQCIHGDETASFESGMWTLYNLVAARTGALADSLQNAVVILNPVYNPDGHERYIVYYNSIAVGSADPLAYELNAPGVARGRQNHYRFDMNRDRVAFSQDETRAEFAEMLRWGPQVYIDQHGQVGSYFFPPEPMAVNPNTDRTRNAKWTEILGKQTAKAFDQLGYSYFVKDKYDFWYPGYVDISSALSGAIGMTHETDGGRYLSRLREDGSELTLRHGMAKHFTSALTIVKATSSNGPALLKEYQSYKAAACNGAAAGPMKHVVVSAPDPRPLKRLQKQLGYAGVTSSLRSGTVSAPRGNDYWSGAQGALASSGYALQVDLTQPQAHFAKALLEPTTEFEPEFVKAMLDKKKAVPEGEKYPGPEAAEFYDFTGWSLPYAHGLNAFWAPSVGFAPAQPALAPALKRSPVGYALKYQDQEDILAVCDLMKTGVRTLVSQKPMKLDGIDYPSGTFLFLTERNDDNLLEKLRDESTKREVTFTSLTTAYPDIDRFGPGSDSTAALVAPNIALVMGRTGSPAGSGALWWLFEREFKLPFTPIGEEALNSPLLDRFTAVILPSGVSVPKSGRFRDWIAAGHVAVAIEGGADLAGLEEVKGDFRDLPGSLFRAQLDARSFLSYGYPLSGNTVTLAVPVSGSRFYKAKKEGGSFITFSPDPKVKKLLTGWEWPDETEKALGGTAWCQDTPIGAGRIVFFAQDLSERALWPGLNKLLLNAAVLGASR